MNEIWCDEGNFASFCKVLEKISYKNSKSITCLLGDIEFPTKAICYHKKTFHIGCLLCVEFCQVLLTLVKIFVMLPRLRSRTRLIYMLLLHWKYATTYSMFIHPLLDERHMLIPPLAIYIKKRGMEYQKKEKRRAKAL